MLRVVVRRPNLVRLLVRELPLDRVRMPALLVEQRRCHAPEAVSGHLRIRIAEPPECRVDGVVAHRAVATSLARKYESTAAGQRLELPQDLDGLAGERHEMRSPHLHPR